MINLIRKTMVINKKYVLIAVLASCFFSSISLDGNKYYTVALMMCPALLFVFVVGKVCYIEGNNATRSFLDTLPVAKKHIILEKNILGLISIALGLAIAQCGGYIFDLVLHRPFYTDTTLILYMGCFMVAFTTLYLILNYLINYSAAQTTTYGLAVLMAILFKYGKVIQSMDLHFSLGFIMLLGILIVNYLVFNIFFNVIFDR